MTNESVNRTPYWVSELRDAQTGELKAGAICTYFGFDQVDFAKLHQDNNGLFPTDFDGVLFVQGCDVLSRLALAIVRKVDPERKLSEEDGQKAMHAFMSESVGGVSQMDRVRQGDAVLILEEIYGGVHKDPFGVKRDDDGQIAEWLGFDRAELAAIARATGLGLFEAIASARRETGMELSQLSSFYQLAAGSPGHGVFADRMIATMCGGGGLLELYNLCFMLSRMGLRETNTSPFGKFETVYSRPAAS